MRCVHSEGLKSRFDHPSYCPGDCVHPIGADCPWNGDSPRDGHHPRKVLFQWIVSNVGMLTIIEFVTIARDGDHRRMVTI